MREIFEGKFETVRLCKVGGQTSLLCYMMCCMRVISYRAMCIRVVCQSLVINLCHETSTFQRLHARIPSPVDGMLKRAPLDATDRVYEMIRHKAGCLMVCSQGVVFIILIGQHKIPQIARSVFTISPEYIRTRETLSLVGVQRRPSSIHFERTITRAQIGSVQDA